jgi:peptidoglycan hydrolase-like protein with peptidoglycan-binding domain
MSAATILAILSMIIQTTPEAIALFQQVKDLVDADREPTPGEWAAITSQMAAAHNALQAA